MAQTGYTPISLYYSTTAAAAPTAGNLVAGELALNTQDEKLYFKNAAGTVKLLASSAGASGDVVGPASATDNAIPTYDGTTGKLIKNNSGATISSGTITATGFSGPLNGTVGATTPNTGAFTTLSASGTITAAGGTITTGSTTALNLATSGGTQVKVNQVSGATNWVSLYGGATSAPRILAEGADTNINFLLSAKGTGTLFFNSGSDTLNQVAVLHTASANRYITLTGSNGAAPVIGTSAGDLAFSPAGTERMRIDSSGNVLVGNTTDVLGANKLYVQSAGTSSNNRTFSVYNTAATSTTPFANRLVQISSSGSGADATLQFSDQVANNAYIGMGGGSLYFASSALTELMRITSSGNVGIGTSSPSYKLQLNSGSAVDIETGVSNSAGLSRFGTRGSGNSFVGSFTSGKSLELWSAGSLNATLDSSGNLGLGVTPSAWYSTYRAFEGASGALYFRTDTVNDTGFMSNSYRDASAVYRFKQNGAAAWYAQGSGQHQFYTSGSTGTAGDPISFTQAMTLDASGNLALGLTGTANRLDVSGGTFRHSYGGDSYFGYGANRDNYFTTGTASGIQVWRNSSGTEFMRLDSSGNLLVGTTTSTAKLTSVAGSAKIGLYVEGYLASNPTAYIYRDNTDSQYGLWIRHDGPVIGSGGTGYMIQFQDRNGGALGTITSSGTGSGSTAYNTSSDYRLKNDVQPMQNALAKIELLKPCTFKWSADNSDGQGFIAHELQEVFPEAVTGVKDEMETYTDDDGVVKERPRYQGIDTSFLVATLTAALQEAVAEINSLKARLDAAGL